MYRNKQITNRKGEKQMKIRELRNIPFDKNGRHATGREVLWETSSGSIWVDEYEGDDTVDLPTTEPWDDPEPDPDEDWDTEEIESAIWRLFISKGCRNKIGPEQAAIIAAENEIPVSAEVFAEIWNGYCKNKIKAFRKKAGITQFEMSEYLGIPRQTITNWERHVNEPPVWVENLVVAELKRIGKQARYYKKIKKAVDKEHHQQ